MSKPLEQLEQFAIDVILERRFGKRAGLLRVLLYGLSLLYHQIVRGRLWVYEQRIAPVHALGCLVVSVGNLTVGGTGKTPIVEKLARELTDGGRRVAILSRGYRSKPKPFLQRLKNRFLGRELADPPRIVCDGRSLLLDSSMSGDEPYMLAKNLKNVVVLVDKDRVKSGRYAIEKFGVDTLILDDGFQYLPLKERFDTVLVDRETPFGNRFLLPRGMLREPPQHLRRANLIFITKCDGTDLAPLKEELRRYNRHAPMIECSHHPRYLENVFTGEKKPLELLLDQRIGAISGIARPESFEAGLNKLGGTIVYSKQYADHHRFSEHEILHAIQRSRARNASALITTEKDAVRFVHLTQPGLPVYFLRVEIEILHGQPILDEVVQGFFPRREIPAKSRPEPVLV